MADGEAEAHALLRAAGFGGKVGVEDLWEHVGGNAVTFVGEIDADVAAGSE